MFTYIMTCPTCGIMFEEFREYPYKTVRKNKRCKTCKIAQNKYMAYENKGTEEKHRCETCIHFGAVESPVKTNQWWKACARGYYSADDFGKHLVYLLDWCGEHDSGEDGDD